MVGTFILIVPFTEYTKHSVTHRRSSFLHSGSAGEIHEQRVYIWDILHINKDEDWAWLNNLLSFKYPTTILERKNNLKQIGMTASLFLEIL